MDENQTKKGKEKTSKLREAFGKFAKSSSQALGSAVAFSVATAILVAWLLILGPVMHFSDSWQLIINTATTIITFLMVFLIQNTQNRDSRAVEKKLDELIRALDGARNEMIDLEDASDEVLDQVTTEYRQLKSESAS